MFFATHLVSDILVDGAKILSTYKIATLYANKRQNKNKVC